MLRSRPSTLAVLLAIALAFTLGTWPAYAAPDGPAPVSAGSAAMAEHVPGQVLVKFKSGVGSKLKSAAKSEAGATTTLKSIDLDKGEPVQLLSLRPGVAVEEAVRGLEASGDVEYAEPNYIYQADYTPGDPDFGKQWGLDNTGQDIKGTAGTPGADIAATDAWDSEKGRGNPATVAVLDSGVDFSHPDLDGNLAPGGWNFAGISQTHVTGWARLGNAAGSQTYSQSIKGTGQNLTHVGLRLSRVGSPPMNILVGIQTVPGGGANLASVLISAGEVGDSPTEVYKQLSNAVSLANGGTYYIVVSAYSTDPSNYYNIYANQNSSDYDRYVEGNMFSYNPVNSLPLDLYFRTNPNANPRDDNGHGTHVSGIIGAEEGNGIGGVGACFGPRILPVKVLNASGSGTNDTISEGIRYAADNGARVINMSLGGSGASDTMQNAVNYAYDKGATVFASSGNTSDTTMNYPAGYDNVVGVGATTNQDTRADFSTYNSSVDISAPGKDIFSTMPTYPVTLNYTAAKNYDYLSGTSMACPMAAGVGSLVISKNPGMSPSDVESALTSTAEDLGAPGRDDEFGYGRVNAARALGGAQNIWYLPEGSTAWGFGTTIAVMNPNNEDLSARFTYMTDTGPVDGGNYFLKAQSQVTVDPGDNLGQRDFSTRVECNEGKRIAVDRTMYWWPAEDILEAHNSIGVNAPARTWYLPEGSCAWGFETFLLIQNPNSTEATCDVTYMIEGEAPFTVSHTVPSNTRKTYKMIEDLGGEADASIKVEANIPVIPERSMYRDNRREGHDSIGTTSPAHDYYLAEGTSAWGFTTYVLIQNPSQVDNEVTVTYMTPEGPVQQEPFVMGPDARWTIQVNSVPGMDNTDFSTKVHGTQPLIAERAMYWDNGTGEAAHDSIGMSSPHTAFYLPAGETGLDFGAETWTLVQNPNDTAVAIEVSYLTQDAEANSTFNDTVPANSRKTYDMAWSIQDRSASVMVRSLTPGKRIMCERAMYWLNRSAGTDTIGGYSD